MVYLSIIKNSSKQTIHNLNVNLHAYENEVEIRDAEITRGLDDCFYAPHSRHTEVKREDIEKVEDLEILSESDEAGVFIVANKSRRQIFITGHLEYDRDTLKLEYLRDLSKGLPIDIPKNYFENDDVTSTPLVTWRESANIVFGNWLNYCVYQDTPYNIDEIN